MLRVREKAEAHLGVAQSAKEIEARTVGLTGGISARREAGYQLRDCARGGGSQQGPRCEHVLQDAYWCAGVKGWCEGYWGVSMPGHVKLVPRGAAPCGGDRAPSRIPLEAVGCRPTVL